MSEDLVISMEDLRKCGMCASGVRRWFLDHNLDFKDFLANGIASSALVELGDALGLRAVELTRKRRGL
ncbi:hypothetical protein ABDF71_21870 [Ochrobactrum sp. WV_118_8]